MSSELIGFFCTILAVIGVALNNKKLIYCFPVWLVSNFLSGYIHFDAGIWSLVVRDVIFLLLAIHGYFCWRKR